ncbi:MAG: S8 family serine peptidase, partial [Thermoleophilaceae bacterium]
DGGFSGGWTPAGLAAAAYAGGAGISNNSWGTGTFAAWGDYSARSAAYDRLVRDAHPDPGHQPMVEVFAAGNDGDAVEGNFNEGYGTISAEGSAKNVITVGASEGVRPSGTDGCGTPNQAADNARDIVDFSSRGPTDDGRLKPDLVAPGSHVTGAAPQHPGYTGDRTCTPFIAGSTLYSIVSGSSQSAPQVSGAAALVRRWYEQTHPGPPSPALTKALLINTATDLAGGLNGKGDTVAAGPNTDQGWGRVNVGNVFDSTPRELLDQTEALSTSGDSSEHAYAVQDATKPVKVTLAWTDAPGPTTGSPVVNNLDLVVDAGGRTYKGNVFAGAFSRPGGSADPSNNVESVYLPEGTSGRFAVKVVGTNIPGDGIPGNPDSTDQDFALIVSNADEESSPVPVLVHDQTTIDDSGAGGDGDGALEPGESFQLGERLRNAGNDDATTVSGTLGADAGVTVTDATSSWPNIAAGASQTSNDGFAGQITAGCGEDATASLAIMTTEGPHTVPLTLPTGAEGTPETPSRTYSPPGLAIPDDSAAGVTSTINIPTSGRIKDLDVRIPDLDHDWVGDLRIDITSPDGTTVTLAAHPGGPDNRGKDLVNPVFD